jgi:hypothetical protein
MRVFGRGAIFTCQNEAPPLPYRGLKPVQIDSTGDFGSRKLLTLPEFGLWAKSLPERYRGSTAGPARPHCCKNLKVFLTQVSSPQLGPGTSRGQEMGPIGWETVEIVFSVQQKDFLDEKTAPGAPNERAPPVSGRWGEDPNLGTRNAGFRAGGHFHPSK